MVGRRELDSVVEHVVAVHVVAREEGARVAALVLEDPLVADRVDRDGRAGGDRQHRGIGLAREPPPQHGVGRRAQVVVPREGSLVGLQNLECSGQTPTSAHRGVTARLLFRIPIQSAASSTQSTNGLTVTQRLHD